MRRAQRRLLAQPRLDVVAVREQLEAPAEAREGGRVKYGAREGVAVGRDCQLALAEARLGRLGALGAAAVGAGRATAAGGGSHRAGRAGEQRANRLVRVGDGALKALAELRCLAGDGAGEVGRLREVRKLGADAGNASHHAIRAHVELALDMRHLLLGNLGDRLAVLAQLARELGQALLEVAEEAAPQIRHP